MSRHLGVYRCDDFDSPIGSGRWSVREDAVSIFDTPFGAEGTIRECWSLPASRLGLPLLASIYEYGFHHGICWHGSDLARVLAELPLLESYWHTAELFADQLDYLTERSEGLRTAVSIAQANNAAIIIT